MKATALLFAWTILSASLLEAAVHRVDAKATGENNGSSWADAFPDLQLALSTAVAGDEIWVARGIYLPGNVRSASFTLKDGVALYGGFAGHESQRDQRNPDSETNGTVLSGDLDRDDHDPDGNGVVDKPDDIQGNNAYHVIDTYWAEPVGPTTIVDGFTLTAGRAIGRRLFQGQGGGIFLYHSQPTLRNLRIVGNRAFSGGGLHAQECGTFKLENVSFIGNAGGDGGGVALLGDNSPQFSNATFRQNSATIRGGGIHQGHTGVVEINGGLFENNTSQSGGGGIYGRDIIIQETSFIGNATSPGSGGAVFTFDSSFTNCQFLGNEAERDGGGLSTQNATLNNVAFVGNTAGGGGGGAHIGSLSTEYTLTNLTVYGNSSVKSGGGLRLGASPNDPVLIRNSIVWNNSSEGSRDQIYYTVSPSSTNNIIQGQPGASDPLFVDPDGPDDVLGTADDDLRLRPGSPGIDAGDNAVSITTLDAAGRPRFADDPGAPNVGSGTGPLVDLGAYENGRVLRVDADSTVSSPDGLSWATAFPNLTDALALAEGNEIWVAAGIYHPSPRFDIRSNVRIYGGFSGLAPGTEETERGQRNPDPHFNNTVLDGDLNDNGRDGADSPHVVSIYPDLFDVVLDGFVIRGGHASGASGGNPNGAGVYLDPRTTALLQNLHITENHAKGDGGGIYTRDHSSSLTLRSVQLSHNTCEDDGAGAMLRSDTDLFDVIFLQNTARSSGGGLYLDLADFALTNVRFLGNRATGDVGGAIRCWNGAAPTLINAEFSGNSARNGGAIANNKSTPIIHNSTFYDNSAGGTGGAIYSANTGSATVYNSIFWNNSADAGPDVGGLNLTASSRNNLVQSGDLSPGDENPPGTTQVHDPIFHDADGLDNMAGTLDDDLRPILSSPAVDAGDFRPLPFTITKDLAGNKRIVAGGLDLGAHELSVALLPPSVAKVPVPDGNESIITNWAPDLSNFNEGAGFEFTFSNPVLSGDLQIDVAPKVDPDGTLRLTPTRHTTGRVTYQLTITDPSATYAPWGPITVTIETGSIRHVNLSASGAAHGRDWDNAFTDLQSALAAATWGDEVWVAAGTYVPDEGAGQTNNAKASTFLLQDGIAIYGGFPAGGSLFAQRNPDPETNGTILSGDIDGNRAWPDSRNSYHVVSVATGVTRLTRLDGFTITHGNASGASGATSRGGGMTIAASAAPTIANVFFHQNRSSNDGGAVMVVVGGTEIPLFQNVHFKDNAAADRGGAVYNWDRTAKYIQCRFEDNTAPTEGGAMFSSSSNSSLEDCFFEGNESRTGGALANVRSPLSVIRCTFLKNVANSNGSGGAAFNNINSDTTFEHCQFIGNSAGVTGGALRNRDGSDVTILNSTFSGNTALSTHLRQGGAIWNGSIADCHLTVINCSFANNRATSGGAIYAIDANPVIHNSIFHGNVPNSLAGSASLSTASRHNLIDGADSPFRDSDGDDDQAGTIDDDLTLPVGSPAIGMGDATLLPSSVVEDLAKAPRVQGLEIDLGAYESNQLGARLADVPTRVPRGDIYHWPNWVPDGSAFNNGTGYLITFTRIAPQGSLVFVEDPVVDPSGTLSFTLAARSSGSATFEVDITDPGGNLPPAETRTITFDTPNIHYVDQAVRGGSGDGSSWSNAYSELRSVFASGRLAPNDEIWVAAGLYTPGTSPTSSFTLHEHHLYGGFPVNPPNDSPFSLRNPDPETNNCILSGEIGGPAVSDNSHQVVRISGSLSSTVDGFRIRGGNARGSGGLSDGGGILVEAEASAELSSLIISDNHANRSGGGVAAHSSATGTIRLTGVTFKSNSAGTSGGALDLTNTSTVVEECYFLSNTASSSGGAVVVRGGKLDLTNSWFEDNGSRTGGALAKISAPLLVKACAFTGNRSTDNGGALWHSGPIDPRIINSVFSGNRSGNNGGAIYTTSSSQLHLDSSTLANNVAAEQGGGIFSSGNGAVVKNSIFWDNDADKEKQVGGTKSDTKKFLSESSRNNLVDDGYAGTTPRFHGLVSEDNPRFVDQDGADDIIGTLDDDLRLQSTSPAIARGNHSLLPSEVSTDFDGNPRFVPLRLDLGAFESPYCLPGEALDVVLSSVPDGSPTTMPCWIEPDHGLQLSFTQLATTPGFTVLEPPVVSPNGDLDFTLAQDSTGMALFDVITKDQAGNFVDRYSVRIRTGLDPKAQLSIDHQASRIPSGHVIPGEDPPFKRARIRGYLHPPGTRKGIALFLDGFSTSLPSFVTEPTEPSSEIGKQKLGSDFKRSAFNAGFDVYTFHWHDPRTWIEDNSVIVADFLEEIADGGYAFPGYTERVGPDDKVAVIGVSMGGLIARTALCYLDTERVRYQADLFLSVDSPQEGAYIPIGLQHVGRYIEMIPDDYLSKKERAKLLEQNTALAQPAPREMLLVHRSRSGDSRSPSHAPERDKFLSLLNRWGNWPSNPNLRMAAIASGRGDGLFEEDGEAYDTTANPSGFKILEWKSDPNENDFDISTIPASCIRGIGTGSVSGSGTLTAQLFMTAYGPNPSSPGTPGRSLAFCGDAVVKLEIDAKTSTGKDRSASYTVRLDLDPILLTARIRNLILDAIAPDGIVGVCQTRVYGDIEASIEERVDELVGIARLAKAANEKYVYATHHWDWLPGGTSNRVASIANDLKGAGDVTHVTKNHCFIPTTSALAISKHVSPQLEAIPPNAAELSPFDELYHFGTHANTGHVQNSAGNDYWLSSILRHELNLLTGDFAVKMDENATSVSWLGPYFMEEFVLGPNVWERRSEEHDGVYFLPEEAPAQGLFRLGFQQIYEIDPTP